MELSYLEVLKTINNFAEENNLKITANDIKEINSVYNSLKNEKINVNKNKFETESLITMITQDVISGSYNRKKTMLQHSDFRHMGYFDRWFKEGVSEDITNILNSYGITTDVFKGIPRLQNFQNEQYINGHSLEIIQTADDDSPPNANIILRVDGQVVYDFENEISSPKKKEEYYEDNYIPDYDYYGNTKSYNKNYIDSINNIRFERKKKPVQKIFEVDGNIVYQTSYKRRLKSGKSISIKQFRYTNGRFASKDDRLQIMRDIYGQ